MALRGCCHWIACTAGTYNLQLACTLNLLFTHVTSLALLALLLAPHVSSILSFFLQLDHQCHGWGCSGTLKHEHGVYHLANSVLCT